MRTGKHTRLPGTAPRVRLYLLTLVKPVNLVKLASTVGVLCVTLAAGLWLIPDSTRASTAGIRNSAGLLDDRNVIIKSMVDEAAGMKRSESAAERFTELRKRVDETGIVPVIIHVRAPFRPEAEYDTVIEVRSQRELIKLAQANLLDEMIGYDPQSIKLYEYIPYLAVRVNPAGLAWLNGSDNVIDIEEDLISRVDLAESVKLIGGPEAWAAGYGGAGQTIAIVDTGVDKDHPLLKGKVVAEACYSTNFPTFGATSICAGGTESLTISNSGLPCKSEIAGCEHGTHVAGIAAGRGSSFSGVARDAEIISIQIYSRLEGPAYCGPNVSECIGAFDSDLLRALEHVYQLQSLQSIAAVNLSLGSGRFNIACDAQMPATKAAIDLLRGAGIATVTSSGNSSYSNAISNPACISSTISVGSTTGNYNQPERVSTFSNSSFLLSLLAPGEKITSSIPGGYKALSGTSMAAPHVAGAFAIARQRVPNASVSEILKALTSTGVAIRDPRNNIVKSRIQINAALSYLGATIPANPAPFAPQMLVATAKSKSQIDLTWKDNSTNETGFRIREWVEGSRWSIIGTVGQGVTIFQNNGLKPGESHTYSVVAFNNSGESASSNEALGTTPLTGPAPPTQLTVTALSETEVQLNWQDNSTEESGFRIRRRRGMTGSWAIFTNVRANTNSIRLSGLIPGSMYYFTVSAINLSGESVQSNEAMGLTGNGPPSGPTRLRAIAMSVSQITLKWQDNSTNETGFRIRRRSGSSDPWKAIADVGTNDTSYDDSDLAPGTTSFYQVSAINLNGESPLSNEADATTLNNDGVSLPSTPSELIAMAYSNSTAELHWLDNSGNESGFQVWERESSAGAWKLAAMVGPGITIFMRNGLVSGQTYYYYVKAYNSGGESISSNQATIIVPVMGFTSLNSGQSLSDTADKSESRYFRIYAPPGTTQLTVETTGIASGASSGNVDLYLRSENQPSRLIYNCRSIASGSTEKCIIQSPQQGNWHVLVYGSAVAASSFKITATYTMGR
jgi:subtilisin family serine protease